MKRRILVVDDDYEIRQALVLLLEREGYAVDLAQDASEALNKLRSSQYDLVLTDIEMPGMSGLQLMRILILAPIDVDFMVITADDSFDNREEATRLGAKGYFVKPFDVDQLLRLIQQVITTRSEKH
jgi:CheY-like chemotaxis protein